VNVLYKSTNIAKIIKKTAKAKNIQLKDMFIELELNKDTLSNMYRGSMLKGDSLARIADYLDCSVDYLLGRTDERTGTYHANNVSSSFVQNDGAVTLGSVSVSSAFNSNSNDIASSKEETEILDIYRSLNIRNKTKFLNLILDMEKEENN